MNEETQRLVELHPILSVVVYFRVLSCDTVVKSRKNVNHIVILIATVDFVALSIFQLAINIVGNPVAGEKFVSCEHTTSANGVFVLYYGV